MNRTLPAILTGLLLSTTAAAEDDAAPGDGKVRFKLSTGLYQMASGTVSNEDAKSEYKVTTSGIILGAGSARTEVGYMINNDLEAGAFVELSSQSTKWESDVDGETDDGDAGKTMTVGFMPYFAYNMRLSEWMTGYAQVFGGIHNTKDTSETTVVDPTTGDTSTEEVTSEFKVKGGGLGAGVRLRFTKHASLDLGAEFFKGAGTAYSDGDEDKDNEYGVQNIGLRTGVSIRI